MNGFITAKRYVSTTDKDGTKKKRNVKKVAHK
jgi:hypothetical protein